MRGERYSRLVFVIISAVEVILLVVMSGCGLLEPAALDGMENKDNYVDDARIHIFTTTYNLYEFTRVVGGDKVQVTLLPFKSELGLVESDYFKKIEHSDLFIYVSDEYEPWIDGLIGTVNKPWVKVLRLSDHMDFSEDNRNPAQNAAVGEGNNNQRFDSETAGKGAEVNYYRESDPDEYLGININFWLDFEPDEEIVNLIAQQLSEMDPANEEYYAANAAAYNQKLRVMGLLYEDKLANCKQLSNDDALKKSVLSVLSSQPLNILREKDFITIIYDSADMIILNLGCEPQSV